MTDFQLFQGDCLSRLAEQPRQTVSAVITDPPFGGAEFTEENLGKLRGQGGGNWRQPRRLNGNLRQAVPRYTTTTPAQKEFMMRTHRTLARLLLNACRPGAHNAMACTPMFMPELAVCYIEQGWELRTLIVRCVHTMRGGDRPKNYVAGHPLCVLPRSTYEPWLLLRKPLDGTVAHNLARHGTGALQRLDDGNPFSDMIMCGRTPLVEKRDGGHPSQKPLRLMIQLVRALAIHEGGLVVDPFMGSGTTGVACARLGRSFIGIEKDATYFAAGKARIEKAYAEVEV